MHITPGDRRPEQASDADRARATTANAPPTTPPAVPDGRAAPADRRQSLDGESPLAPEDEAERLAAEGMDVERLAELRRRVLDGAYDTPAVAEQIARRMLERGDL